MSVPTLPLPIGDLDHYTVNLPDGERALAFYTSVLGFTLDRIQPVNCGTAPEGAHDMMNWILRSPQPPHRVVVLTQGLTENSIFTRMLDKFGPGIHHVAYTVTNLDAAVETLKAEGVRMTSEEVLRDPVSGLRQIFIHDEHAGHFVELIERTDVAADGTFFDANMARLANTMEGYVATPAGVGRLESRRVTEDFDVPPSRVLNFVADIRNLGRWTCHTTIRCVDGAWVEVRMHQDVAVAAGEIDEGQAFVRWTCGRESRTTLFDVEPLANDGCRLTVVLPLLDPARLARTVELIAAELRILRALLEERPDADLSIERKVVARAHLEVYRRRGL